MTDPKRKAALVRQCIETARVLSTLQSELLNTGSDLNDLHYRVSDAADHILRECLKVPCVRVAVFPIEDKEGGAK